MTKSIAALALAAVVLSTVQVFATAPTFVDDIGSGCSWVDDNGRNSDSQPTSTVAIAVPISMFSGAAPTCNGGYPVAVCRVRTKCQSHTKLTEYNNQALRTECWGMITGGKPDCTKTFQGCPAGQKTCDMTPQRCYNSRGVSDQLGVNYDFVARGQAAPQQNQKGENK